MQELTTQELRLFAPQAREEYLEALVAGRKDMEQAGITTPLRLCEFLAQVAHETGGFVVVCENLNYTARRLPQVWPTRFKSPLDPRAIACAGNPQRLGNTVYGGRLGNKDKGDGYRYRGRGFLQDTGRDCYREYGALIGMDLEANPELLETAAISLKVALARWRKMHLNRFADRHYTRAIGNAINRGNPYSSYEPIGARSRLQWFDRAWQIFGDGDAPKVPAGMGLGAYGAEVEILQARLKDKGYGLGALDAVFGPATARAVVAFKVDHKRAHGGELDPDEVVAERTQAALNGDVMVELSPERLETTAEDLHAAGSTEIAAGKQSQGTGWLLLGASAAEGTRQAGGIDAMQKSLEWVPSLHNSMVPVVDAIQWGLRNAFWVVTALVGIWVWTKGRQIIKARLEAHRLGFNLWR